MTMKIRKGATGAAQATRKDERRNLKWARVPTGARQGQKKVVGGGSRLPRDTPSVFTVSSSLTSFHPTGDSPRVESSLSTSPGTTLQAITMYDDRKGGFYYQMKTKFGIVGRTPSRWMAQCYPDPQCGQTHRFEGEKCPDQNSQRESK